MRGFPIDAQRQKRDLKSDVLFVRTPDADYWMQFRDVYEVDGKPVRDRAERLTKLFLEPSRSVKKQAEDIAAESARYNIGGVNRNINLPVLALSVLETHNRPWVVFSGSRKKDVWDVEFREERGGTLIRTTGNQSMPSRGHFLIDAATGRVLSSDLIAESGSLRAHRSDLRARILARRPARAERDAREVRLEGRIRHRGPRQLRQVPPLSGADRRKDRAGEEIK